MFITRTYCNLAVTSHVGDSDHHSLLSRSSGQDSALARDFVDVFTVFRVPRVVVDQSHPHSIEQSVCNELYNYLQRFCVEVER